MPRFVRDVYTILAETRAMLVKLVTPLNMVTMARESGGEGEEEREGVEGGREGTHKKRTIESHPASFFPLSNLVRVTMPRKIGSQSLTMQGKTGSLSATMGDPGLEIRRYDICYIDDKDAGIVRGG